MASCQKVALSFAGGFRVGRRNEGMKTTKAKADYVKIFLSDKRPTLTRSLKFLPWSPIQKAIP